MLRIAIVFLALGASVARANPELCKSSPPTTGSAEARGRAKAVHDALCGGNPGPDAFDAPNLTETERFALVTSCLDGRRPSNDRDTADFIAWCADELAKWDPARATQELGKLGIGPHTKVAATWDKQGADWRKHLADLASDPAWKQITAAAAKAASDWAAALAAHQDLYDQAHELTDAASADPDAAKGCTAKAIALMNRYLGGIKPTTVDKLRTALEDPAGAQIYRALLECSAADSLGGEAFVMTNQPPAWEGGMKSADALKVDFGGPHVAAIRAAAVVIAKLGKTDKKWERVKLQVKGGTREELAEVLARAHPKGVGDFNPARGTIAAIKPQSDGRQLVTFKTETQIRDVGTCKSTGEISRINSDGTVEYGQDCKVTGHTTEHVTPHAIYVAKDLAAGLKAGKLVSYFWSGSSFSKGPDDGAIFAIWGDAKRTTLTGWAGTSW